MQRHTTVFLVAVLTALVLSTGMGRAVDEQTPASDRDRQLQQKWDAWYARQVQQDCVQRPYDDRAMSAVRRGHQGNQRQFVFGPSDPYKRKASVLQNLKTRPNPRGEGVLVSGWDDQNPRGSADYSRMRSVWLVLEGKVYPVNTGAAGDLGRLYHGMPENVQKRAGLTHTYQRGQTMMDQLGIEEQTFERRFSGGNPFPMCP